MGNLPRFSFLLFHQMLTVILVFCLLNDISGLLVFSPNGTLLADVPHGSGQQLPWPSEDKILQVQEFYGDNQDNENFKIMLIDQDSKSFLLGAKNFVYNISIATLTENQRIEWTNTESETVNCFYAKQKSEELCHNFIRLAIRKKAGELYICGTNAFAPLCRTYQMNADSKYEMIGEEENGIGKSPFDPFHNSTTLYADEKFYAAITSDYQAKDPLIYSRPMRTEQHNSEWLNEPNFVSSFDYGDKVYYFFREIAIEYINCGKAIFSRVARVCKNDMGGKNVLKNVFTSFFKARLNCSIPGEYPFYFDEIQSTSDVQKGNYMSTLTWDNRTDMVYAVFNTPQNSITGSAVCAYRFKDILDAFSGRFKEQKNAVANWLPVNEGETPGPHPAKECANDSKKISTQNLEFIKSHPMMDSAVPAFGGEPILVQTSFRYRLTKIAIDWQVLAADRRHYDILFIGTDDGRILKAINKGHTARIETVVIEDIQIFEDKSSIEDIKVFKSEDGEDTLIVSSRTSVRSIPLHRCHLRKSCGSCVALQDPYCAWKDERCVNSADRGIISVEIGTHVNCPFTTTEPVIRTDPITTTPTTTKGTPCDCPQARKEGNDNEQTPLPPTGEPSSRQTSKITKAAPCSCPNVVDVAEQKETKGNCGSSVQTIVISVIFSVILSLIVGFLAGYKYSLYRHKSRFPTALIERSLQKNHDQKHNDNRNLNCNDNYTCMPAPATKQLNVVFNPLKKSPNGVTETVVTNKPVKKVYL